jgi:ABC-type sugar transport system permease subunit
MRTAVQRQNWLIAVPVILLLLWAVIYPNAAVIAGSFENGLGHWR